jgi:glutamate formiminotransferase/formiminotetrahydrofolate cyclodeaminase
MTTPIVECVANYSEARRPEVVEAIQAAIAGVANVFVLDRHSDDDHNRTVITFAGSPAGIEEAAFRSIATAAELIDLNQHTGEHPRIGATDVVPFVPISEISMDDCVEIAKRLGRRVGEELGIPVYLYEEAATQPERVNLEKVRRGQFEGLKKEIETNPNRAPDFGPSKLGPAGATVIGARQFLVAYNVYLTTDDVEVASKIARTVRHSSGGLRFVKALGMLVDGRAQVSMNLTNFRKTPLPLVVETIRREAQRYGVAIHHSELVGLIPQAALVDAAVWYTQMDQFEPDQILETRLYRALQAASEQPDFLDALASGTPTPGGGSAAAQAGAMGAALVAMVARLTIGKKKYASVETQMESILDEAESLRSDLSSAVQADAAAFEKVMAAYKIPKDDPNRPAAIQGATLEAAQVPLQVASQAARVFELALQTAQRGNTNAITDAATGAALARAALSGAGYNVRINALELPADSTESLLTELGTLEERIRALSEELETTLRERGGISPG